MQRKWRVSLIVCVGVFMSSLDLFIVNIAFPDIRRDFDGTSLANLSWILNAYAIVFAALLVPAGRISDRAGRKRGFLYGETAPERPLVVTRNSVPIRDLHATILAAMGISPRTDRHMALVRAELGQHQSQRRRQHESAAGSLHDAGADQEADRRGDRASRAGEHEDRESE